MKILYLWLFSLPILTAPSLASEITIQIAGAVYASGNKIEVKEFSLPRGSTVLDAFVAAGGFSEAASVKSVKVKRKNDSGSIFIEVDAIECLKNPLDAPTLEENDIIWVPEIVDAYPAPHYYNRLLFEWALLKLQEKELPSYWINMVQHLDRLGQKRATKFKEWSEPVDADNPLSPPENSKNQLDD